MGWGGVITFMFLHTQRHSNLIIFLAVLQTQVLLFEDEDEDEDEDDDGGGDDDYYYYYEDDAADDDDDDDDDDDEDVIYGWRLIVSNTLMLLKVLSA